ncbi:MAG: hypothetical protein LAP40_21200 [Acidobacteriia bacterium]|nr:hypothetical protein [Terriglobia bacterium]
MQDVGIRIASFLLLSGVLLFATFLLFSLLYPRKAMAAAGPPPQVVSQSRDYGYLAPVARPLEWTLRQVHTRATYRTGRSGWGWAIVVTTFLVNLVLLPFRILAARNSQTMRAL